MIGFVTRRDIVDAIHQHGKSIAVSEIMRKNFPILREADTLDNAQTIMQEHNMRALPVVKGGGVVGLVTVEDITRVYAVMGSRR